MRAKLFSLATAVPKHELRTEEVIVDATKIFGGRQEDFDRMMPVYANTGENFSGRHFVSALEPGFTAGFLTVLQ